MMEVLQIAEELAVVVVPDASFGVGEEVGDLFLEVAVYVPSHSELF